MLRATTASTFSTSQLPKVVRQWCVLCILTSKCASRHNGVHFFDISTSKSGPTLRCFVHFHFEMCFAPQRRALFQHLNSQKWSAPGVFCTLWTDGKAEMGKRQREEKSRREKMIEEKESEERRCRCAKR